MKILSLHLNLQLIITVTSHGGYISREFSAILFPLSDVRELVRCCFKTWDKNDRKDASVIMYLLEQGLSSPFYDPLANGIIDIQEISNTYQQGTLARTRCLNSLVNHYLTLYFTDAEQFLHMAGQSGSASFYFNSLHRLVSRHLPGMCF